MVLCKVNKRQHLTYNNYCTHTISSVTYSQQQISGFRPISYYQMGVLWNSLGSPWKPSSTMPKYLFPLCHRRQLKLPSTPHLCSCPSFQRGEFIWTSENGWLRTRKQAPDTQRVCALHSAVLSRLGISLKLENPSHTPVRFIFLKVSPVGFNGLKLSSLPLCFFSH